MCDEYVAIYRIVQLRRAVIAKIETGHVHTIRC